MTGKLIAVANMKGGVGKTTTVVGLAEALAAFESARVLVIDLDAQASASMCFAGDGLLENLIHKGQTIDAFLEDHYFAKRQIKLDDCIRDHVSKVAHINRALRISLVASSPHLRSFEWKLISLSTRQGLNLEDIVSGVFAMMSDQIKRSRKSFDYIVVDCPPGISVLAECTIRMADLVIVPTIPDSLSAFGLQAFCHDVWTRSAKKEAGDLTFSKLRRPRGQPHVLLTRRESTKEQNSVTEVLRNEALSDAPRFTVFDVEIQKRTKIAEAMGAVREWPTFTSRWGDDVIQMLDNLQRETRQVLNG